MFCSKGIFWIVQSFSLDSRPISYKDKNFHGSFKSQGGRGLSSPPHRSSLFTSPLFFLCVPFLLSPSLHVSASCFKSAFSFVSLSPWYRWFPWVWWLSPWAPEALPGTKDYYPTATEVSQSYTTWLLNIAWPITFTIFGLMGQVFSGEKVVGFLTGFGSSVEHDKEAWLVMAIRK